MLDPILSILLALLEGVLLIFSPCILPILPIMLSGSLTGSKSRPYGIIVGFVLAFTCITFFSRIFLQQFAIDATILRNVSFAILIFLGIMMLSEGLTEKFSVLTNRLMTVGSSLKKANDINSGFWGGLLFGSLVGVIWTPCAGPILAAVIVQVITQKATWLSLSMLIAFSIGVVIPMLLIALVGRNLMNRFSFIKNHLIWFRKSLGILLIGTVIYLILGSATITSAPASESVPNNHPVSSSLINGLSTPYKAPAIEGIDAWINSDALTLEQLKGKVVLIDFWTYSCINCIRTLPYLKAWYAKYHALGLEIIGIHSPEFAFEQDVTNVQNAVKKFGIHYPVALDNRFVTWQNYQNHYWPAHYLINKEGKVVYEHFGEGEYDVTENNIRYLLGINSNQTSSSTSDETYLSYQTPETYLGYNRADSYAGSEGLVKNTMHLYSYPDFLPKDGWALSGYWQVNPNNIVTMEKGAAIRLHFYARKVFAVMNGGGKAIRIQILVGNKKVKEAVIDAAELYTLVNSTEPSDATVEIVADQPGLELYTFTFG